MVIKTSCAGTLSIEVTHGDQNVVCRHALLFGVQNVARVCARVRACVSTSFSSGPNGISTFQPHGKFPNYIEKFKSKIKSKQNIHNHNVMQDCHDLFFILTNAIWQLNSI